MRSLKGIKFNMYGKYFMVNNLYNHKVYKIVKIPKDMVTDYYTDKDYYWIEWGDGGITYYKESVHNLFKSGGWVEIKV